MSAWHDRDALTAFVRSDVHRKAMTTLQPHMDDPQIKTYDARGSEVPPTWPDLARELGVTQTSTSSHSRRGSIAARSASGLNSHSS